jgi:hypothetical protein
MTEHRLDCRIAEDVTEEHCAQIMSAWRALVGKLERGEIPKHLLPRVMNEAERWTRLVRALEAYELRLYRFHAFRM